MLQILVAISQKFCCSQKKHEAMQKLFMKIRKKVLKKWTSVQDIENNGYSDARLKKEKMNKIAHVFLQSCFQVSKERYVFKEQNRIRLATIYIQHTSRHMHILIWLYDSTLFGYEVWLYNICIASMLYAFSLPVNSTKALVVGRERHNIIIVLVRIHKYHIYWETWECHTMEALSFILKTYKNSKIMVEQRTWDIMLDLIVLSFSCSRPKRRLRNPMVEGVTEPTNYTKLSKKIIHQSRRLSKLKPV